MSLIKKNQIQELIKDLCLIPGLSGYEDNVRKYLASKLNESKLEHQTDVLGNLICTLQGDKELPSVMLFAHMDQLGFVIKKIEDNGFLRVERLGGVPEKSLASQEVAIQSEGGKYFNGIIGNKSHHATSVEEKYKVIAYRDVYIDAGFANKNEVINVNSYHNYLIREIPDQFKILAQHKKDRSIEARVNSLSEPIGHGPNGKPNENSRGQAEYCGCSYSYSAKGLMKP